MADDGRMTSPQPEPAEPSGFFRARWRGMVPLRTLFWRDMVVVATGLNLATSGVALALLGAGYPLSVVLPVYFAPLTYNIFLFLAVWRTSGMRGGWVAQAAPLAAAAWLAIATVI